MFRVSSWAASRAASARLAAASTAMLDAAPAAAASSSQPQCKLKQPADYWQLKLKAHIIYHRNREKEEASAKTIRCRKDVFMDNEDMVRNDAKKRLEKLSWWLNNIGDPAKPDSIIRRSPDQMKFHQSFTDALLPKIFGADWNNHSVEIMQARKLKKISYEVIAITPRS
jgi:hypothetical protein